jgi:hypothetical protein
MKFHSTSDTSGGVIPSMEADRPGIAPTDDDDTGDVSRLGACILGAFAVASLIIGGLFTWGSVFFIERFLFKIDNSWFTAAIMLIWTVLAFCMTPTFGNARKVKRVSARLLHLPITPLEKDQ